MRKLMMITLVLAAALSLGACGGSDQAAPADQPDSSDAASSAEVSSDPEAYVGDPEVGATAFTTACEACHGPGGVGIENLGKDMTVSEFIRDLDDDELLAFVKQGRQTGDPLNTTGVDMPPKGGNPALNDEDLLDIIAYIRTLQEE